MSEHPQSPAPTTFAVLLATARGELARDVGALLAGAGYSVLHTDSGARALDDARTLRPDTIVLDGALADIAPATLCRALREDRRVGPAVPLVVLTDSRPTREALVTLLGGGAWACLELPLDPDELLLRLATYARVKREVDRTQAESLLDTETGLYSRQGIARRARELGAQAFRQHSALACVVFAPELEADASADRRDHAVVRCAEALKAAGRGSDAFGRLGPMEFAVLAPATDAAGAVRLAERLGQTVAAAGGLRLRAGYEAVANFGYEPTDPVALLFRAATGLRAARKDPSRGWIRDAHGRPAAMVP